jgi:hypothetical protein
MIKSVRLLVLALVASAGVLVVTDDATAGIFRRRHHSDPCCQPTCGSPCNTGCSTCGSGNACGSCGTCATPCNTCGTGYGRHAHSNPCCSPCNTCATCSTCGTPCNTCGVRVAMATGCCGTVSPVAAMMPAPPVAGAAPMPLPPAGAAPAPAPVGMAPVAAAPCGSCGGCGAAVASSCGCCEDPCCEKGRRRLFRR